MKSSVFLNKIKSTILKFDKGAEVILYGSRARGDFKDVSDWDFLLLLNCTVNEAIKEKLRDELFEIELVYDQAISTIIHSKKNWEDLSVTPLYKNIKSDGIKL